MPRIAKSLDKLRSQVNALAPNRDKSSDGWLGDAAHAARKSDHNPASNGVVYALDITHDPAHGVDTYDIADQLRSTHDSRIKYIISNGRIAGDEAYVQRNGGTAWQWKAYHGSNPHDHHFHVSVDDNYDDVKPWEFALSDPIGTPQVGRPKLQRGDSGAAVRGLQKLLGVAEDGDFGVDTERAVKKLQLEHGLVADGIVGVYTWRVFDAPPAAGVEPVRVFRNIKSTVFNDVNLAYGPKPKDALLASLPARFQNPPKLWIKNRENGKTVIAEVGDVGPWNGITKATEDRYWDKGTRPQAETGVDLKGRTTNRAGIDIYPSTATALGIPYKIENGKVVYGGAMVDWGFADEIPTAPPPVTEPPPPPPPPVVPDPVPEAMGRIETIIRQLLEKKP